MIELNNVKIQLLQYYFFFLFPFELWNSQSQNVWAMKVEPFPFSFPFWLSIIALQKCYKAFIFRYI